MRKGITYERRLIEELWKRGFAAIRVAGSGLIKFSPDIVAGNGKKYLAIEVKMRKSLPLYINETEVKDLEVFANRFGAEAYIALKLPRADWKFFKLDSLKETKTGYKIDNELYNTGLSLDEVLGKFVQRRFEY